WQRPPCLRSIGRNMVNIGAAPPSAPTPAAGPTLFSVTVANGPGLEGSTAAIATAMAVATREGPDRMKCLISTPPRRERRGRADLSSELREQAAPRRRRKMSGPLQRDGATASCGDSVWLQDITPGIGVAGG